MLGPPSLPVDSRNRERRERAGLNAPAIRKLVQTPSCIGFLVISRCGQVETKSAQGSVRQCRGDISVLPRSSVK